jgi:hypothetical protein
MCVHVVPSWQLSYPHDLAENEVPEFAPPACAGLADTALTGAITSSATPTARRDTRLPNGDFGLP